MRRLALALIAAVTVLSVPAQALAIGRTGQFVINALLPGRGQAQDGRYTKAAILGGATVGSYLGLFASQINYDRSAEGYEGEKATYLRYGRQLSAGTIVSIVDINNTFQSMTDAFDEAGRRYTVRNVFVGALAVIYAVNLIDLITSEKETGERNGEEGNPALQLDVRPDAVMVYRSFGF